MIGSRRSSRRAAPGPTALLLDFDGTLAVEDVTVRLLEAHATDGWRERASAIAAAGGGSRDVMADEMALLPQDLRRLLDSALAHELDPGAGPLVDSALAAGWHVEVASDGFGFYVRPMLERAGIDVPIRAADVVERDGRLVFETPWRSRGGTECALCATCKLDAVRDFRAAGCRVILVGDGRSDRVAAGAADVVYATGLLADHCTAAGIPFRPWCRLADVLVDLVERRELPTTAAATTPTRTEPPAAAGANAGA